MCVCCVQVSAGLEVRQDTVRPQQEVVDGSSAPLLSSSQLQLFEADIQATIRALEQQEKTHTPDDERVTQTSYAHTNKHTHHIHIRIIYMVACFPPWNKKGNYNFLIVTILTFFLLIASL